ncbi:hypothetical protein BOTBODRAFT_181955 [Botryobasidium botryosum FD-172 SS1]|uniref:Uncharacterized protein n=1 Tax=Botryobasidium botryosum (strain FD-172 SS1) TaxID=930990 RepID=A0A067M2E7_BOTB1|nr:hypothetical protein BOTBODRAFT_181955 [Botryobasidium botryosum FD-172 SS1]
MTQPVHPGPAILSVHSGAIVQHLPQQLRRLSALHLLSCVAVSPPFSRVPLHHDRQRWARHMTHGQLSPNICNRLFLCRSASSSPIPPTISAAKAAHFVLCFAISTWHLGFENHIYPVHVK